MMIEEMESFKDFVENDEAIATNILAAKLKRLEQYGLIKKTNHPTNKKTKFYRLTETGLGCSHFGKSGSLERYSSARIPSHYPQNQKTGCHEGGHGRFCYIFVNELSGEIPSEGVKS